jgi:outer membrane lipopolysaccharide assembly protein LptE/RlpB
MTRGAIRACVIVSVVLPTLALLGGCGYHVADRGTLIPATVKTIAVPAFGNATNRYKLTDQLPEAIKRELIARTRYRLVTDPSRADAILRGAVTNYSSGATVIDTTNNRAGVADLRLSLQVSLVERSTGKVLFNRPSFDIHESYEVSEDPRQYFEETDTALSRVAKEAAQQVVTAILDNF